MTAKQSALSTFNAWRSWSVRFHKPLLAIALIIFAAGTYWSITKLGLSLEQINAGSLAILIAISPLTLIYSGVGLQLMAVAANTRIPFGKSISTSAIAILAEALPLPGGAIVRTGALMAAGAGLKLGSVLVIITALMWIALGALGAGIGLIGMSPLTGWALIACGSGVTGLAFAWLWFKARWRLASLILAHRIIGIGLVALRLFLAFGVLGVTFPFVQILPFVLANIAGSAAAITPSGLGVSEALAALAAPTVKLPPAAAFLAVGIDRVVYLALSLIVSFQAILRSWLGGKVEGDAVNGKSIPMQRQEP